MSKGRKPDQLRILSLLDGREGFSTRQIKRALNLSDKRYEDVRDELLRDGLVEKYACRGGGLRLTRKGKKAASQSSAPATEEDEVVSWSTGTGFFVSASGHVLTNAHVIEGVDWVQVSLEGEAPHLARVVAKDADNDLALLQADYQPKTLPIFRRDVEVGEDIATYGFPLLDYLGKTGKFTTGTVSANIVRDNTNLLQIQAPVQPGNSGGPLFDQSGNVVGVVVSKLDALELTMVTRDIPQLVNFAIKSDIALSFLSSNRVKVSTAAGAPRRRSGSEIASHARLIAVLIECNVELASSKALRLGQGGPQDDTEMVERLRLAADDGDAAAQFNLGVLYADGEGVPQDDAEAAKWFRRAADQGDADAECRLGAMYLTGGGVPQDDSEAVKWFRRAADQDNADAQSFLGGMYAEGRGVPQEFTFSYMWLSLSAAAGVQTAQNALDVIARQMTASQIAKAQNLAREWKPKAASVLELNEDQEEADDEAMYAEGRGVDTQATYIDTGEQAPIVDRRSWPGASAQVIETINRVLGAAAERFEGLSLTNTKNYFTAHFSGEGSRTRTDWCFHPKGELFLTDIRQPRSPVWDNRLNNIRGLELLEYSTNSGGRYRLRVFPTCGQDAISAIVDLASETLSRKAHSRKRKKASKARASVVEEPVGVPQDQTDALKYAGRTDKGDATAEAVKECRRAAEQGNAAAQSNLGLMYDEGRGVARDYAEALKWYGRAADQGNATAQYNLGAMYEEGQGVPQNDTEAVKWFRRAADQGDADAQYNLGLMYEKGRGVSQDEAEALKWYRRAAGQGNTAARSVCESLERRMAEGAEAQAVEAEERPETGRGSSMATSVVKQGFEDNEGVPQGDAEVAEWYRRAADQGDADAQFNVAAMYARGRGVPQDDAETAKWLRRAADQDNADAQLNLGFMYDEGRGVPQDEAEAVKWYRRAADQGHAAAQFNLGMSYHKGRGLPQDDTEALKWYRRAADQGDAAAQVNLAVMYAAGQGVPQDYTAAVKWFRHAAGQGDAFAQFNLGLMYGKGQGVPNDYTLAYMWLSLSAAAGDQDAQNALDLTAGQMTPKQIAKAKELVSEWKPK